MIIRWRCVGDWEKPVKLDAPVSGSIIAAEAGTLTFMVLLLFYSNTHNNNTILVLVVGWKTEHLILETRRILIFPVLVGFFELKYFWKINGQWHQNGPQLDIQF